MVIEKLRQNFKREAAEQAQRDNARAKRRSGGRSSRRFSLSALSPKTIINHPRFAFILGVWGAALLGFSVLALSSVDIARVSMVLGLGALGALAKIVYAAIAALVGGVGAFITGWLIARFLGSSQRKRPVAAIAAQLVRPIDPVLELGSDSLDAPIEDTPFFGPHKPADQPGDAPNDDEFEDTLEDEVSLATLETAVNGEASTDDDGTVFELNAVDEVSDTEQVHSDTDTSVEPDETGPIDANPVDAGLDTKAFAAILKDETRAFDARKLAADRAHLAQKQGTQPGVQGKPAPAAVVKLRETAPQDLSLMQLVERFAAALHDVQSAEASPLTTVQLGQASAERERALAQALKALEFFTSGPTASPTANASGDTRLNETERDLRDALTKLQTVRGAA